MLGAIVGHLVGDYLLQNDWMALNKKKDTFVCLVHCFIWSWSVMLFGLPWTTNMRWPGAVVCLLLLVTHFIQDRTDIVRRWMTWNGQDQFATGPCAPWSIIVVDNVWHIVTIFAVWKLFGLDGAQ